MEAANIDIETSPFRRRRSNHVGRGVELFVLGLLILIFIMIAIDRLWMWRITAEQTGVMHMEGTIRSALGMVVMKRVAEGKMDQLAALDGSNPMDLLDPQTLPPSYLGELTAAQTEKVKGYRWYFDKSSGQLVYVIGNPDAFESALPGKARALFRIKVQFNDDNGNGRFDGAPEQITGVYFAPVVPFQWREP